MTTCPLTPVSAGFFRSCCTATAYAAVVSRVLSYQLTYFLSSQPLGPVYKPQPAEDVEYGAWKIDGHSPQLAECQTEKQIGEQLWINQGCHSRADSAAAINNSVLIT